MAKVESCPDILKRGLFGCDVSGSLLTSLSFFVSFFLQKWTMGFLQRIKRSFAGLVSLKQWVFGSFLFIFRFLHPSQRFIPHTRLLYGLSADG